MMGKKGFQALIKLAILGTRGIPARYGGFETFAEQLSIRLVARGISVTVFCPTYGSRADEEYRGVRLRFVAFPKLGKYSEMIWDARCYCAARRGFDVVYMLGLGGAFATWVPRMFGRKVWVNTDGIEWKRTKFTLPQKAYLALAEAISVLFASKIVADAHAIESYLRKRYLGLVRVATIAYGAEVPLKTPDSASIRPFDLIENCYYLIVCRLEPENLILEMIQGFERSHSEHPLVIVGGIDHPNHYVRSLLERRSERVKFLGTVYEKDTLTAIRSFARAYLHGHTVGGTNPSLLEAMACANLVIAHSNRFNREVLGTAGLFFDSPADLSNIIDSVDRETIEANDLRAAARSRVLERYTWDHIADQYAQLLAIGVNSESRPRNGPR